MKKLRFSIQKANRLNNFVRRSRMQAAIALQKMPLRHEYLGLGKYGRSCPRWFIKKFGEMEKNQLFSWFLADGLGIVLQELSKNKYKIITSNNWQISRFTTAKDILRKRLRTCGTMALLVSCGLRSLGIPTKLIHGYINNPKEKCRHAWNEIYFPEYRKFLPLDVTRLNYKISSQHIKVKECIDWEELEGQKWNVAKKYRKLK